MPDFTDTSTEAETIQLNLLRQAPPRQKLQMLAQLNQTAHSLAYAIIYKPEISGKQINRGAVPNRSAARQHIGRCLPQIRFNVK